ncbi:MAG TPA: N-acetylmuramoyl-L-alanine amidase [Chthoniobacterales bacterium]|nr:N-acetylmuramoyl-L-alanine amidase [Chthoniobacterales bacterium]
MLGRTLFIFLATPLLASATEWQVLKQNGRDYVSFQNVAEFYRFADYSHANRTISLRSDRRTIRAQVGTSEVQINGVRFFTCFPLLERAEGNLISAVDVGKIIEPVLRPSRIKDAQKVETVVLDPGHGGMDIGTQNAWGTEKNFALDVALAARAELERAGFKVEMTRTGDNGLSIEERVDFANRYANAVFISIHFNSGSGGNGVESFRLAPEGVPSSTYEGEQHPIVTDAQPDQGNAQDNQNIALAAAVHAAVLSLGQTYDRGVRHARFKVLRHIRIPAMLLEAGFLNNPIDGQRIASPQYRQQLGVAIAHGVQNYNTAVNYRAPEATTFAAVRVNLPPHSRSITEPLHSTTPPPRPPEDEPSLSIDGGE